MLYFILTVTKTIVCFMNLLAIQQIDTIRASHGLIASYIIYVVVKLSVYLSLSVFFLSASIYVENVRRYTQIWIIYNEKRKELAQW